MDAHSFAVAVLSRVAEAVESGDDSGLRPDIDTLVKSFAGEAHVDTGQDPDVITVLKTDPEKQMAWGWALVSVEKGQPVTDLQGDEVSTDELQHAVHGSFMTEGRVGKLMHQGGPVGEVVDSIVFTKELQDALGIDLGREGWFVGMKIHKKSVWELVKSGHLPAFSIGGEGERHPVVEKALLFDEVVAKAKDAQGHGSNRHGPETAGEGQEASKTAQNASKTTQRQGATPAVSRHLHGDAAIYHERAHDTLLQRPLPAAQRALHTQTPEIRAQANAHKLSSAAHNASSMGQHGAGKLHAKAATAWTALGNHEMAALHTGFGASVHKAKDAQGHGSNGKGPGAQLADKLAEYHKPRAFGPRGYHHAGLDAARRSQAAFADPTTPRSTHQALAHAHTEAAKQGRLGKTTSSFHEPGEDWYAPDHHKLAQIHESLSQPVRKDADMEQKPALFNDLVEKTWSDAAREAAAEARKRGASSKQIREHQKLGRSMAMAQKDGMETNGEHVRHESYGMHGHHEVDDDTAYALTDVAHAHFIMHGGDLPGRLRKS